VTQRKYDFDVLAYKFTRKITKNKAKMRNATKPFCNTKNTLVYRMMKSFFLEINTVVSIKNAEFDDIT